MKKLNIALVAGGYSGERVISLASAAVAEKHIDKALYNVYKIEVDRNNWTYTDENGAVFMVNRGDFTLNINNETVKFDVALIIIHGTPGEDGKLQGYFDMLQIPYTSCDAITSALTFNKRWTVATAAFSGIPVAKSLHLFKENPMSSTAILEALKLPVFVKPNNGGSSIGMSKVDKAEDLDAALAKAFNEDTQILVEEFIKGREFTVGCFKTQGELVVLPICEVRSKKAFFDYEAKYEGASEEIIPAPIDEKTADILRGMVKKIYQIFNCKGIVRADFIWNEADNQPYMLEINTVPGQSESSLVPQMVKAYGWTMQEFYTRQIQECLK
jgi:D-alanine-D-alanine ligase